MPEALTPLTALLLKRTGVHLSEGREELAAIRVRELARERGLTLPELVAGVERDPELREVVIATLLNHETLFFRDHHPFQALRDVVLPRLVERRRAERRLRVWSCACSTGQEAYSLAILLQELDLPGWDLQVYASDVSDPVLERARAGRYSLTEVNRGLPARLLLDHFEQDGLDWRIKPGLRRLVQFQRLNLIEPWPDLPPMDLVLLRNVLLYFGDAARRNILRRLQRVVRPDGYLLLGGAETTVFTDRAWTSEACGRTTIYRLDP